MYVQATWSSNLKEAIIIGSLVEGVDWVDCSGQCEKLYPEYSLKSMNMVPFAIDPWNVEGDVYVCIYKNSRNESITIYVLAESLREAWDQVRKFEPQSIQMVKKTNTNYKTKPS